MRSSLINDMLFGNDKDLRKSEINAIKKTEGRAL